MAHRSNHRLLFGAALLLLPMAGCTTDNEFSKTGFETAAPSIRIEPPQVIWTGVPYGEVEVQTLTVGNEGDAALNVANIRVEQSNAFTVLTELPFTVPSGGTKAVEIAYEPVTDEDLGRAFVESNDPTSPTVNAELIGTSGSPRLVIDPPVHDFGAIAVLCRDTVTHTLRNEGTADLLVQSLYEIGESYTIEAAPEVPFTLAPGEEAEVQVRFAPILARTFGGALYVESNDPAGVKNAAHEGAGLEDAYCVEVTPGDDVPLEVSLVAEYRVADIAFLLDTTGSMSGLASAMASEFSGIAADVNVAIPDATFGVATYEDYNFSDMGSGVDTPFRLEQQQTSDLAAVQSKLSSIGVHSGDDITESSIEALFQGATGRGFDQACNGSYDAADDVYPFIAQVGDAFNGTLPGVYDPDVPDTGELGGFGFRESVLPIFIYATDAPMRDPDAGDRVPTTSCPAAAGMSNALNALNDLGAKTIGIAVGGNAAMAQMEVIAAGTGSYGDMDGDGTTEPAAVTWSGRSDDFRDIVVEAIDGLVTDVVFDVVWLEVKNDTEGLVRTITPSEYTNVPSGQVLDFTIEFEGVVAAEEGDQTFPIDFELNAQVIDKEVTLDRFTAYVLVPGS
jgi:hypothetical protein